MEFPRQRIQPIGIVNHHCPFLYPPICRIAYRTATHSMIPLTGRPMNGACPWARLDTSISRHVNAYMPSSTLSFPNTLRIIRFPEANSSAPIQLTSISRITCDVRLVKLIVRLSTASRIRCNCCLHREPVRRFLGSRMWLACWLSHQGPAVLGDPNRRLV